MPGAGGATDKSLILEGLAAGWYRVQRQPFAEPGVAPHYGPDRAYAIEHLHLQMAIDPAARAIQGAEARLKLAPTLVRGPVRLHLDEVEVREVVRLGDGAETAVDWRHRGGELILPPLDGPAEIAVRYDAAPRRGLYFVGPTPSAPDRRPQAWTQCQDEDGHFLFPCFDHPSVRHSVSFEISAPDACTVVANGRVTERAPAERAGWTRWSWRQDRPIPVYLITIVVAELDTFDGGSAGSGDTPVRYLVPSGAITSEDAQRVFGQTGAMIDHLEQVFGVAFPWDRYDQVVVSDFIFGGMENAAATTLMELTLTDARADLDWDAEELIAHELAHQWFGDLVTCQDWSQGWLNEGWASYSEVIWAAHRHGDAYAAWYVWSQARAYMAEADGRYSRPVITYDFREPIDVFDRHLYQKGSAILHTLRHELGEVGFWGGVKRYLETCGDQPVHTRDFQRALERATGRNLDGLFRQWLRAPGFPELDVKLSWEDGLLTAEINQTQSGEGVPEAYHLSLGLEILGADGGVQRVTLPVRERKRAVAIPCDEPARVRVDPGYRLLSRLTLRAPRGWLIQTLQSDACPIGRIRAAKALRDEGSPQAIDALAAALAGDADWFARAEFAAILGSRRGERSRAALLAALDDPHHKVRAAAVEALGALTGDDEVAQRLAQIVERGDASLYVEGGAGKALGEMRSPRARAACEALLERPAWGDALATRALAGLGALQDEAVQPTLLKHTAETYSPRTRSAAVGALGRLAHEVPDARRACVDRLIDLARDAPFRVVLAAVSALGQAGDPRGLGVLADLHASAPDGRMRRMAWEASARIRGADAAAIAGLRRDMEAQRREHVSLRDRVDRVER